LEIKRGILIGRGGFGAVFSGTLFGTIPVAVKKIYKFDFEDKNNGKSRCFDCKNF
jgi:hypothetical protein